ncbi:MAG: hypothetical protein HUU02_00615 [Bacteroidetes bacterium]|nr:hypothetical protein [Bacteroidota bacterium]
MPHQTSFDTSAGIIINTLTGTVDTGLLRTVLKGSAEAWRTTQYTRWLNDLSNAEDRLTTLDIYDLPKYMEELRKTTGVPIHNIRIAVVVQSRTSEHLFAEMVSANRGQNIRVFLDQPSAREWLVNTLGRTVPAPPSPLSRM